jgi:hypothetical protein
MKQKVLLQETIDTYSLKVGRRCIARVQKKVGALREAELIRDLWNASAVEDPSAVTRLVEAARNAGLELRRDTRAFRELVEALAPFREQP